MLSDMLTLWCPEIGGDEAAGLSGQSKNRAGAREEKHIGVTISCSCYKSSWAVASRLCDSPANFPRLLLHWPSPIGTSLPHKTRPHLPMDTRVMCTSDQRRALLRQSVSNSPKSLRQRLWWSLHLANHTLHWAFLSLSLSSTSLSLLYLSLPYLFILFCFILFGHQKEAEVEAIRHCHVKGGWVWFIVNTFSITHFIRYNKMLITYHWSLRGTSFVTQTQI